MFPSRSSNRSKIKIVDRPTSGCEPAAVCNTAGAVAAVPTDRATVSAYQASVNNNKQRHADVGLLAVSPGRPAVHCTLHRTHVAGAMRFAVAGFAIHSHRSARSVAEMPRHGPMPTCHME